MVFENDRRSLEKAKTDAVLFLEKINLHVNAKNDIILKPKQGIYFLGVDIFPFGRRLKKRNWKKFTSNLQNKNFSSYLGLTKKYSNRKKIRELSWRIYGLIEDNIL